MVLKGFSEKEKFDKVFEGGSLIELKYSNLLKSRRLRPVRFLRVKKFKNKSLTKFLSLVT